MSTLFLSSGRLNIVLIGLFKQAAEAGTVLLFELAMTSNNVFFLKCQTSKWMAGIKAQIFRSGFFIHTN
jgi:hypothetical protein